jgi:hypothetical protein
MKRTGRFFRRQPWLVERISHAVSSVRNWSTLTITKRLTPVRGFLEDVHFHDIRREPASHLADKLSNTLELSAVTGT